MRKRFDGSPTRYHRVRQTLWEAKRRCYYFVMAVRLTFMRGNAVRVHHMPWPSWYYLRRWRTAPVQADVIQWRTERKLMADPEWNTDFHMPDSFYDPPDEQEPCECDDVGCHLCDREIAKALAISTDPRG